MKHLRKVSGRKCVLGWSSAGWSPAHCPLEEDCRFWSRLEDRCRYGERLLEEQGQPHDAAAAAAHPPKEAMLEVWPGR